MGLINCRSICLTCSPFPLPPDAWKSPINLTQESHERVKRSISADASLGPDPDQPKAKRPRLQPAAGISIGPMEPVPAEIVRTKPPPEGDAIPRVLLSQVQNVDGLERAVV